MADAGRTTAALQRLRLEVFPEDWVKNCWDEDFVNLTALPVQAEELLNDTEFLNEELDSVRVVVNEWLESQNENENGEGFWSILVENDISHKALVAVTAYLVHNAGQVSIGYKERVAGVLSASIYLKLVALPGSSAFKIYHPDLLLQACRLLTKWNKTDCDGANKRKRVTPNKKGQSKRQRGHKRQSHNSFNESSSFEEEQDTQQLNDCMGQLLKDVLLICEKFSLRQSENTASQLLSLLVSLTRMNPESITEAIGHWDSPRSSAGILAYKGILLLCRPFHSHVTAMTNQSCKLLIDHILMLDGGKLYSSLLRPVVMMRQQALDFVTYLVGELGERCHRSVKTLIQHLSYTCPDKSDHRSYAAQSVMVLLQLIPDTEYVSLLQWFKSLSKGNKVSQRSFVVDLMLALLEQPERKLTADSECQETAEFATHKSMVCTLLSRCSDMNAGVRARALVGFSKCMSSTQAGVLSTVQAVITPAAGQARPTAKHFAPTPQLAIHKLQDEDGANTPSTPAAEQNGNGEDIIPENQTVRMETENLPGESSDAARDKRNDTPRVCENRESFCNIEFTPGFCPYLPDNEGVVSMFRRRVLDLKVVVRKAALQALQKAIEFEAPLYSKEDLSLLQERCADPALSARKQAIQSLFELLRTFPQDKGIQRAWLLGLLPRVLDTETTVQEKCFELLEEMILKCLQPVDRVTDESIEWQLLDMIANEANSKLRRYLQKACQFWARTKKLTPQIIRALQSHIGGPHDQAAWMFLCELSKTPVKIDPTCVLDHWKQGNSIFDEAMASKWSKVLNVMAARVSSFSADTRRELLDDLLSKLRQFSFPLPVISGMVNAVTKLQNMLHPTQRQREAWGGDILKECDKYMSDVIIGAVANSGEIHEEEQLIRYMFTLGEVCQRCPSRMPKRAPLLIQSIIAAPCIGDSANISDHHSKDSNSNQSDPNEANSNSQSSHSQPLSSPASSQPSQSQSGSTQPSQPLSQFRGSCMSSKLRAHSLITLGKLCLIDEVLAKKMIAALARELEESDSPAVRNNVVIVMGDLAIRYTTLVDLYITNIAACLKDASALVRKNTLTVLTRLLQEEYVKWKGVLFFRYITTLLDEVEEIKQLAEFCLEHLFLKKLPTLFFQPFIECIFYFNDYQEHAVYNKFKQTEREKYQFTLAGPSNARRRQTLYAFMLENMTDEQRFKITAKVCKEILAAIVDQIIPLDKEGCSLLQDALVILSCKEIKLSSLRTRSQEDVGEEGGAVQDMAQVVTTTAKKFLITQVVKRNVMENIVPVVISLKHMLEKKRSPLLRELMGYLRELMKDYKTEVKDILAADRQLAEEIEFDLRNFEAQELKRQAKASGQSLSRAGTPTLSRPSTPEVVNGVVVRASSRAASPAVSGSSSPQPVQNVLSAEDEAEMPAMQEGVVTHRSRPSSPVPAHSLSRSSPVTIKEAAKKAMSRVDQLRLQGSPFSPVRKSSAVCRQKPSKEQDNSGTSDKGVNVQDSEDSENSLPLLRTEEHLRAISTPTNALYDITFRAEGNITLCPPSPISSVASAANAGQVSVSPTVRIQRLGSKDVIHMPHPDAKDPEPVKWNILSPTRKTPAKSQSVIEGTPNRQSSRAEQAGLRRSRRKK